MMKCEDARAYVDAWEAGEPSPWKPGDFSAHLSACPRCESRYGALAGAMERDGAMERTADAARARNAADIALSNTVMEAISRP
ncbi:MAG TPA: zf-HC2 domain-containing protein, partial [Rectinemataceae bacterium]